MKIIHTADWHLGQKFYFQERYEEQEHFLTWLIQVIKNQEIEALLLCGDVFDVENPSHQAQELYYGFLVKAMQQNEHLQIIIIAGNHDSGRFLTLPQEIFKVFKTPSAQHRIHVVGQQPQAETPRIIPLYNQKGVLKAQVAAIPFLKERELRPQAQGGESFAERQNQVRQSLKNYYDQALKAIATLDPQHHSHWIALGHLYARGGERDQRANRIHFEMADTLWEDDLNPNWDYLALGHLHRPQQIGQNKPIYYSGSPIPMDFNEHNYPQIIKILDLGEQGQIKIKNLEVPLRYPLRWARGPENVLKEQVLKWAKRNQPYLIKLEVEVSGFQPNLEAEWTAFLKEQAPQIQLLKMKQLPSEANNHNPIEDLSNQGQLQDYQPQELFDLLLAYQRKDENVQVRLRQTFTELLSRMSETD